MGETGATTRVNVNTVADAAARLPADGHQRAAPPRAGRPGDPEPGAGGDRPPRLPPLLRRPVAAGAAGRRDRRRAERPGCGLPQRRDGALRRRADPGRARARLPHRHLRLPDAHPDPRELPAAVARAGWSTPSSSPTPTPATRGPAWLRDQGIPFSSFGRVWDDPAFTRWVDVDGHHGTGLAVAHCVAAGYATIGYLGSPAGVSVVADARRTGWLDACRRRPGGSPAPIGPGPTSSAACDRSADELVAAVGPGGAVVCATDLHAVAVLHAVWRAGLEPGSRPRDRRLRRLRAGPHARAHQRGPAAGRRSRDSAGARGTRRCPAGVPVRTDVRTDGVLLRPGLTARSSTTRPPDALTDHRVRRGRGYDHEDLGR